jgi:S1-C subfamily serine protease
VADYNEAISHARLHGDALPSVPGAVVPDAEKKVMMGTGFFVTSTGYILTDNHVVKGASTIRVKVGSNIVSAVLAAADASNDLALLKIDGTYPCLPLGDSSGTSLGQTVFTIGFPEPELQGLSPKLTKGEISSLAGIKDDPSMFQISVPVQPGNSGGCLVDESGNVIGLIEATLSTVETAKRSGDLLQNVNYATKINYAKKLLSTVNAANSGLLPVNTTPSTFTEQVKTVEGATVFIIADSTGSPLPASHLYTDSAGNTYSVSESDYQRLYPQKVALDAENKKLDQLDAESKAQAQRIEQDRQNLDNTDPQAINSFNAEVDRHNSFLDQIKQETATFNDAVDRFNTELKRVGTLIK